MSGDVFSKIGRALSIFGVSSPQDIREMEQRKKKPMPLQQEQPSPQTGTHEPTSKEQPKTEG